MASKRDKNDAGTYYVMRYALDEEPYRLDDEKVQACFRDLPTFAGEYFYRTMLLGYLEELRDTGIRASYTVAGIVPCGTHNIVNLLGSR